MNKQNATPEKPATISRMEVVCGEIVSAYRRALAALPIEEIDLERALQRLDLFTDGRLSQAQSSARRRDSPLADHGPEIEQVVVVEPGLHRPRYSTRRFALVARHPRDHCHVPRPTTASRGLTRSIQPRVGSGVPEPRCPSSTVSPQHSP